MKLSKREVILLVLLFITAGAMGFFLFWYAPAAARITELSSQIEQKKNEIEEAKLSETQYDLLSETRESSAAQMDELVEEIPLEFDEAEVIRSVEGIISPYTTDILILFPQTAVIHERSEIYPVEISFRVTYSELLRILDRFENGGAGKLRIADSTISLDSMSGTVPVIRATILAEYLVLHQAIN